MSAKGPRYDVEEAQDATALLYSDQRSSISEDTVVDEKAMQEEYHKRKPHLERVKQVFTTPLAFHVTLVAVYSFLFIMVLGRLLTKPNHGPELIYSPAREAVEFQRKTFDGSFIIDSPFTGEPRPELDLAWHDLLKNANIRVSKNDLDKVGGTSIPYEDGSGYYVQLGVFHELHCLKRIRQFIHSEHYFPNQTEEKRHLNYLHTDHCLEILRQGAMCRGDISLVTFTWDKTSKIPLADFTRPHECVNFNALDDWSSRHAVNAFEPGILRHPTLGDSFPNGGNDAVSDGV